MDKQTEVMTKIEENIRALAEYHNDNGNPEAFITDLSDCITVATSEDILYKLFKMETNPTGNVLEGLVKMWRDEQFPRGAHLVKDSGWPGRDSPEVKGDPEC